MCAACNRLSSSEFYALSAYKTIRTFPDSDNDAGRSSHRVDIRPPGGYDAG